MDYYQFGGATPRKNIFDNSMDEVYPQQELFPTTPIQRQPISASPMESLYTPETTAQKNFNQLIQQVPIRENPSMFNRITSGLAMGYSPEAGNYIRNHKYNEAMQDYGTKVKLAQEAMQDERMRNQDSRLYSTKVADLEAKEHASGVSAQHWANMYQTAAETNRLREEAMGAQNSRAEADRYSREKINQASIDAANKRADEADKRMRDLAKEAENARAEVARLTANQSDINNRRTTETSAENNKRTVAASEANTNKRVAATSGARNIVKDYREGKTYRINPDNTKTDLGINPNTPSQDMKAVTARAQSLKNSNPEMNKWILINPQGMVQIKDPTWLGDLAGWKKTYEAVFGEPPVSIPNVSSINTPTNTPTASPTRSNSNPTRQEAIKQLTDAKKPITEANIKYVMDQLK